MYAWWSPIVTRSSVSPSQSMIVPSEPPTTTRPSGYAASVPTPCLPPSMVQTWRVRGSQSCTVSLWQPRDAAAGQHKHFRDDALMLIHRDDIPRLRIPQLDGTIVDVAQGDAAVGERRQEIGVIFLTRVERPQVARFWVPDQRPDNPRRRSPPGRRPK